MKRKKIRNNLHGYVYIMPSAILLFLFVIIPICMTFYYSMTKYTGFQLPEWIGFQNYHDALSDIAIKASLKNTIIFTLVAVPLEVGISLLISGILATNYRNRFGSFVRSTMFIPVLCSTTLVATIFSYLFGADQNSLVNSLLELLGIGKVNWLGSEKTALGVLIFVQTWKSVGYYLVIFYAAIMDIPTSLYEAAAIDGASKWQQFFRITIPNMKSVIFMVITICTIWSFQFFDLAYNMTGGGPGYCTTSLVYQLYLQGFRAFNFGYASAIAVILFVLILLINLIQSVVMKDED